MKTTLLVSSARYSLQDVIFRMNVCSFVRKSSYSIDKKNTRGLPTKHACIKEAEQETRGVEIISDSSLVCLTVTAVALTGNKATGLPTNPHTSKKQNRKHVV